MVTGKQWYFLAKNGIFAAFFQKGKGLLNRGLLRFFQYPENKIFLAKSGRFAIFLYLFAN